MDRRFEGWSSRRGARRYVLAAILALTALSLSSAAAPREKQARQDIGGTRHAALDAYLGLPLAFVPNEGQFDRRVRYAARARSASLFLARGETVFVLTKGRRGVALRLAFLGASPEATIGGASRSPGRVNYLVGNDPARWQTNLPTYEEVVYRNLWPGIDMAVRGRGGQLKYEFRLAPRADPARIRLAYRGQKRVSLGPGGALRVETALGIFRDARPVSYQLVDGRRLAVGSSFALGREGAFGFALGTYDRRHPLVIDPGLVYSTYVGGNGFDRANEVAVDGAGSAYVTGVTSSTFPTTAGAFDRSFNGGGSEAFVTKLNPAGSALTYSTYLGGSGNDAGGAIEVDAAGSAYVAGGTASTNFPTTAGAFDTTYNRGRFGDAFVAKLSPAGTALIYSTYLGKGGSDFGSGIAVDGTGNAYVAGTAGRNFPTTAGAFDTTYNGYPDAFATKLNAAGSALIYSTYLGGSADDDGNAIAVDDTGSAYVAGSTASTNFPTTVGAFDTSRGRRDAFVTKLNPAGSALAYSTYFGGSYWEDGGGIAVDDAGSAYVTGGTESTDLPVTAGAFDTTFGGDFGDAFVTKVNPGGSALAYSTYLGGRGEDGGTAIAIDSAGGAYVTGATDSTNFPTTAGAFDRSFNGGESYDGFVTTLDTAGSTLVYSTYLGGGREDFGTDIALDSAGSAYVTGAAGSKDFPTTGRAFDGRYSAGGSDSVVAKLDLIAGKAHCHIPFVLGLKLLKAKSAIRARECSIGRIRRIRSKRVGRVLAQSPKAGTLRRRAFKVGLSVGRR